MDLARLVAELKRRRVVRASPYAVATFYARAQDTTLSLIGWSEAWPGETRICPTSASRRSS